MPLENGRFFTLININSMKELINIYDDMLNFCRFQRILAVN